jgi:deoxyuridine 5'-triphosphate nucleotidohydrolase
MFKSVKDGKLPTKGSKHAACVDLYAREEIVIDAGQITLIPLGVAIDEDILIESIEDIESFKSTHYLQLMLRSSTSKHLIIANGVGVIDLDYKDEIMIRVYNPLSQYIVAKGDKIAQITLLEQKVNLFNIHTEDERNGGFGSTGKR